MINVWENAKSECCLLSCAHPMHVRGELRIPKSVPPPSLMQWVVLDVNFQETWTREKEEENVQVTGHECISG